MGQLGSSFGHRTFFNHPGLSALEIQKQRPHTASLFSVVPEGCEDVAVQEVTETFPAESLASVAISGPGVVAFALRTPDSLPLVFSLRSADNVFALTHAVEPPTPISLSTLESSALAADWSSALSLLRSLSSRLPPRTTRGGGDPCVPLDLSGPPTTSFRATCVRKGTHPEFQSPDVEGVTGFAVTQSAGWRVCLKNFDAEVFVLVKDSRAWGGLSLTMRSPHCNLFNRNREALCRTSLKPTIAYGLARLSCDLRSDPCCVLLDPMCGCGTIPIECTQAFHPNALCFGGDIDLTSVAAARHNSVKSTNAKVDVCGWSATRLPLRDSCVDFLICDMPYGLRCGTYRKNNKTYASLLREVARVLRPGPNSRACLYTIEKHLVLTALEQVRGVSDVLRLVKPLFSVDNSGLRTTVFVLGKAKECKAAAQAQ